MKKNSTNIVFVTLLLSLIFVGVSIINKAEAETLGPVQILDSTGNTVEIVFPRNETYSTNSLLVDFTVVMMGNYFDFGYSLDNGLVERIVNVSKISESGYIPYVTYTFKGSILLANLTEGSHSVTVYEGNQFRGAPHLERYEVAAYASVDFSINLPPIILLLSPEAKAYNASSVSLNFTVNEPITQVAYSLDGQENVTVAGNTTLTELASGLHNLTVYAWDEAGHVGASETITFSVTEPQPEPEPFPTVPVIVASVAVAALAGLGPLAYLTARRKNKVSKPK